MYQGHAICIKHNSPLKPSSVSVVLTFNISARCFIPASPIGLPNRTTKTVKRIQKTAKKPKHETKRRTTTAIHLRPRPSTFIVVFTFHVSAICIAPSDPMLLPIYFQKKKTNLGKKNRKRGQRTIHSQ